MLAICLLPLVSHSQTQRQKDIYTDGLYMSSTQYKRLANGGRFLRIYLGIDKTKLYSKYHDEFEFDFMFPEILLDVNSTFECSMDNYCIKPDKSKKSISQNHYLWLSLKILVLVLLCEKKESRYLLFLFLVYYSLYILQTYIYLIN